MPRTHRPYPPEFRAAAVRPAQGSAKSIPALAADLGVSSEALRHWLRQPDADAGRGQPGELTTDEREELRRLRREVKTLQQERESLKTAAAFSSRLNRYRLTRSPSRRRPPSRPCCSAGCGASPARPTTPGAPRGRGARSGRRAVGHRHWDTRATARTAIFEWLEVFYNRQRAHSALAYQPPARFAEVLLLQSAAA